MSSSHPGRPRFPLVLAGLLAWAGQASLVASTPDGVTSRSGGATEAPKSIRVMIDPGHGGRGEEPGATTGDNWDSQYAQFLRVVNYGGSARVAPGRRVEEHELALSLSRRLAALLELTRTDAGWTRFEEILRRLGARGTLPRVRIESRLTRTDDYRAREARKEPDPNRDFRLLDSPARLPAREGTPLHPGRVSRVIDWAPDLLLVLHANDVDSRRQRGMNALFVPSPQDFEAIRAMELSKEALPPGLARLAKSWIARGRARGERESMIEAAWCYYTGFAPTPGGRTPDIRRPDGKVWNHITWAYRDTEPGRPTLTLAAPQVGPFWDRERGPFESRRRAGGPEGLGGDNLYAGQELLRHARLSLGRAVTSTALPSDVFGRGPHMRVTTLTPLSRPLCAAWTLPLYVNSVTAYLELGYLSNARDRWLLMHRGDLYVEGLAAGIYSLAAGLKLPGVPGIDSPSGKPIAFEYYRPHVAAARWKGSRPPIVERLGELGKKTEGGRRKGVVSSQ